MFNNISWQGYWTTLALITAGYYLIIYLLFFRKDFKVLWNRRSNGNNTASLYSVPALQKEVKESQECFERPSLLKSEGTFETPTRDSDRSQAYACRDELNAFFQQSRRNRPVKEELVSALQMILSKYPALKASDYNDPLTSVIIVNSEKICSIHLTEDDVVRVWKG
jgi:hypothetical protein